MSEPSPEQAAAAAAEPENEAEPAENDRSPEEVAKAVEAEVKRPATCSITVYYKSGPSVAAGLYPKRGSRISWTWKVGTRTTPGRWSIVVSCGSAGTLRTSFVVTLSPVRCESRG